MTLLIKGEYPSLFYPHVKFVFIGLKKVPKTDRAMICSCIIIITITIIRICVKMTERDHKFGGGGGRGDSGNSGGYGGYGGDDSDDDAVDADA